MIFCICSLLVLLSRRFSPVSAKQVSCLFLPFFQTLGLFLQAGAVARHGRHSWVRLGIYFDVPVPVEILLGLTSWANISSIVRVRRFVRTAMARNFKGEKENEFGGEK